MRTFAITFFAALSLASSARAGIIVDNGGPDSVGSINMTGVRTTDDFVLASSETIRSVTFWLSPGRFNGGSGTLADFSGTVTYAFYNDNGGSPGALVPGGTGTVSGLVATPTGLVVGGCNPDCPVGRVSFDLSASLGLLAGTYWLELHEGTSVNDDDGLAVYWATSAQGGNANIFTGGSFGPFVQAELAFQLSDTQVTPEPSTLTMLSLSLAAVAFGVRRRRRS